jgi:hypothetical protein
MHLIRFKYLNFFEFAPRGGGGGKDGGGGGGYSPPPPPDPAATAAAQGGQDRATAQTNAVLLNPTIHSPYGNVTYDTNAYTTDPSTNAQTINRPTQTVTLSPAQQQQLDMKNQIAGYIGNAGVNLAQSMSGNPIIAPSTPAIPKNIDYSGIDPVSSMNDYQNQANQASKAYYDQAFNLMNPALQQQQRQLQDQLVNSGNPLNSEAYNTQMGNFQRNQDQALTNLADQSVTQGYNLQNQLFNNANLTRANQIQAAQLPYQTAETLQSNDINQQMQLQNQNTNTLAALLQGQQAIQLPSSPGYNQSALQSPNIGQYTQNAYNNQLQAYNSAYNANQANNNAFNSGLFSIGAAAIKPLFGAGGFFA